MVKNKKKRANDSSDDEETAEIVSLRRKKQKTDDEDEYEKELEYAPLIFHHLSSAKAKEQNQKNMTPVKSSATERKQNTPQGKSKSTDESKRKDETNENDEEDEEFKAEIIDRIAEIDITSIDNSKIESITTFAEKVYIALDKKLIALKRNSLV
jgi:hypothetical protein